MTSDVRGPIGLVGFMRWLGASGSSISPLARATPDYRRIEDCASFDRVKLTESSSSSSDLRRHLGPKRLIYTLENVCEHLGQPFENERVFLVTS